MYYFIGEKIYIDELTSLYPFDENVHYYNKSKHVLFNEEEQDDFMNDGEVIQVPLIDEKFRKMTCEKYIQMNKEDVFKDFNEKKEKYNFYDYTESFEKVLYENKLFNDWMEFFNNECEAYYTEWCVQNGIDYSMETKRFSDMGQVIQSLEKNEMLHFYYNETDYFVLYDENKQKYILEPEIPVPMEEKFIQKLTRFLKIALSKKRFKNPKDIANVKVGGISFKDLLDMLEVIS